MTTTVRVLAPIALGLVLLALWEGAVALLDIPPYLLPAPSAIGAQVAIILPGLVAAGLATGTNALVGLVGGAVLAIAMAALASRIRWLQSIVEPLVAAIAVVPIVALAPVLGLLSARDLVVSMQVTLVPVLLLTRGGPLGATTTLPTLAYERGFRELEFGDAAAIGVLLLLATVAVVAVQAVLLRRWTRGGAVVPGGA